ncbi:pilus assembly protein TadG-related protein [Pseudarthrobacter sp. YS3]|uniref:pilus assembly protein TadG-related protein n=1 Tax=Pseudarthrobacter sp. YS3 TaxID=3453718 RepID=UPI003EED31E6
MRRLITRNVEKERGAAGVMVALLMLVLIGAGAIAVDVGQIYAERAQLQNGADAGAIAVLDACHATPCTESEAEAVAQELADGNSNDGSSTVFEVDMSVPNKVTVRTTTRDGTSGAGFLRQMFSAALNAGPATVGAHATAALTPPGSGSGFPLAISDNCYNLSEATPTAPVQKISYKPGGTCTGPSGTQIPGGWGWLDQSSPCEATTEIGSNDIGSDPGNNPPSGCAAILLQWKATILAGGEVKVAFPIFDDATNQGQNGQFHIIGYATFKVWGWKFGNNHAYEFRNTATDPGMTSALACSAGQDRCVIGQFIKYETIGSFTGPPGAYLGTTIAHLIN